MATAKQSFDDQVTEVQSSAVELSDSFGRAEIDQQIATAKRFPRSVKKFMTEAKELATLTEHVAAECFYVLPRDGKKIEGPSARLAEIIASSWGNCRAGARVVGELEDFVVAQGAFYDLERNVAITYEVKRRIADRNGRRYSLDMIGVTANAACSIALRNAVLKGVPKALWSEVYEAARATVRGNERTLSSRRQTAFDYFKKLGVSADRVCSTLGVPGIEDVGLDELLSLQGIRTAIEEGETTPEQAFAAPSPSVEDAGRNLRIQSLILQLGLGKSEYHALLGQYTGKLADLETELRRRVETRLVESETREETRRRLEARSNPAEDRKETSAQEKAERGSAASAEETEPAPEPAQAAAAPPSRKSSRSKSSSGLGWG